MTESPCDQDMFPELLILAEQLFRACQCKASQQRERDDSDPE